MNQTKTMISAIFHCIGKYPSSYRCPSQIFIVPSVFRSDGPDYVGRVEFGGMSLKTSERGNRYFATTRVEGGKGQ
jgi:hypothetical protein